MFGSFRQAMTWLHTWFGLVLGFVLVVIFFFGTLSVFDREIDRWVLPETRFDPQPMPSFDSTMRAIFERIEPDPEEIQDANRRLDTELQPDALPLREWSAYTTHRDPVLELYAEYSVPNPKDPHDHVHGHVTIDPRNGNILPHDQLKVGSELFYPMHYSLHLGWMDLGYFIVGLAALAMLVALLSGVVIHRKLFRELFTFRPDKNVRRSTLDLHNLTGVVALPFHFMFALTGLIIFADIYFPVSTTTLAPLAEAHERAKAEAEGLPHEPAGVAAPLASVDAMVLEAKRRWAARGMPGEVGLLWLKHVGDVNGTVSIFRAGSDRVALIGQPVHFEASSGRVLREEPPPTVVSGTHEFLTGLHLQHFEHWLLRWFYVFGGLAGCVCIATGLIFFVRKRKRRHALDGVSGARWADALAVASTTGTVIAALTVLVASHVLALGVGDRGALQERALWIGWLLAFVHAALRSAPVQRARLAPAWREQSWAISGLALTAVAANWIATGDHLLRTLARGYWPVAAFDLALLATAVVASFAGLRLRRSERMLSTESTEGDLDSGVLEVARG